MVRENLKLRAWPAPVWFLSLGTQSSTVQPSSFILGLDLLQSFHVSVNNYFGSSWKSRNQGVGVSCMILTHVGSSNFCSSILNSVRRLDQVSKEWRSSSGFYQRVWARPLMFWEKLDFSVGSSSAVHNQQPLLWWKPGRQRVHSRKWFRGLPP